MYQVVAPIKPITIYMVRVNRDDVIHIADNMKLSVNQARRMELLDSPSSCHPLRNSTSPSYLV